MGKSISIGIAAYNEGKNIGHALEALLSQNLASAYIKEIVVVASGCTDDTETIVEEFCHRDNRVKLLRQAKREGKPAAINLWLRDIHADICVMISADVLPQKDAIEKLIEPLSEPKVGFAGSHVIPINDPSTFMGFLGHTYWKLHHVIALRHPMGGEMIAFKNIVPEIPHTACDEPIIEAIIVQKGYKLSYAPDAIVRNKSPETLREYLTRRRSLYVGHFHNKKALGYKRTTMNSLFVLKTALQNTKFSPKTILWTIGIFAIELYVKLLAMYDWHIKRERYKMWPVAESTKTPTEYKH